MAKILIVDDAAFMRMMIKDILTKNGYEVVAEAANGVEAVELYKSHQPDLVTMAKGLAGGIPVGGILADEKVSDVLVPGDHGTTFGGNALAMAAANVVLDELAKPEFLADVAKKGDYIMDTVKSWGLDEIVEVRGKGLMIGIEIKGSASEIEKLAAQKGLLILTAGEHVIRLLPPLVISMDEINKGLEILKGCL